MTDRTMSFRCSESLYRGIEELAHEVRADKSEVLRDHLRTLVLESDADVPDHLVERIERERRKERNALQWQRIHFPSNVAEKFRRAFEQGDLSVDGLGDAAVEDLREMYVEEARGLFRDEDRREAAVEYVEAVARHAADCADQSEFDRLDPETLFSKYAGVRAGTSREGVDWSALVADARDRLDSHGGALDQDAMADSLASEYDVSTDVALDAVEQAAESEVEDRLASSDQDATGSDVEPGTVSESGTVDNGAADLPDHSEDADDVDPSEDAVEQAADLLDAGKAWGVIPVMVSQRTGVSESEALAAREVARDRRGGRDE